MAPRDKALVKNAGDAEQVRRAGEFEKFSRDDELNDVRALLSTYEGRRGYWRLLGRCRAFASIWTGGDAPTLAYNAGRQDVGHELMADVMDADPALWLLMQREALERERKLIEPNDTTADDETEHA